jgi:hypothetical protein
VRGRNVVRSNTVRGDATGGAPTVFIGVFLFVLMLALYLATLTDVHTFDALSYVLDVDRKPLVELFHPHHLAYGPFGMFVRTSAGFFGIHESGRVPLQVANAIAGALGVTLFFALAYERTGRLLLALAGALLLATSYAFWYYAIEVEVYTIAALFLIGALWLMLRFLQRPSLLLAALIGVVQGLAVLFHQTNVLLSVPVLVMLLCSMQYALGGGWGFVVRCLLAYGVPLGVIVGGSYLGIGFGVSGFRSWEAFYGWVAGYATTGWWGGAVDQQKLALLGRGLSETLLPVAGAVAGVVLLLFLLVGLRNLRQYRPEVIVLVSWLVVYGAFFVWWEPDNIEFWIASLPPFYLLLVLGGDSPAGRLYGMGLLAVGATMLVVNGVSIGERGDARRDLQRQIATALVERSAPGDLLLVPDGLQELYLPYYGGRENVFSLNQALFATSGDWDKACAAIHERIDRTLESGQGVLVAAEALLPTPAQPGEPATPLERFGLTQAQVRACYEPYLASLEQVDLPRDLPLYQAIPSAQQLAQQSGWVFPKGRWGWRALNAVEGTGSSGWVLMPDSDPALYSPPFSAELSQIEAVVIRMAATTAARDGQLFFLDEQGRADEARSLRWDLAPGSEMQTYTLLVGDMSGIVSGLRIDPVSMGDGGEVVIEEIRIVWK